MGSILVFGYSIFAFLVLLTVLVFVHEMGHFLVARRNGVRVEVFSIGFGPEIWGWTDGRGTRWKISWIPLGGYVKMFGDTDATSTLPSEDAMTADEEALAFHSKTLRQRAAIVFAGPAINYVFAVLVWAVLFATAGETVTPPEISIVRADSAAGRAGILAGDRFLEVAGSRIDSFEDVQQLIRMSPGIPVDLILDRDGERITMTITPTATDLTDSFGNPHRIGLLGVAHVAPAVLGVVVPGSVAAAAGLEVGDRIVAIDGRPLSFFSQLQDKIGQSPETPLEIELERDGRRITLTLVPDGVVAVVEDGSERSVGRIGIGPVAGERVRRGPLEATVRAVVETWVVTKATFRAIGQMFAGTRTTRELGGPIRIAQMSGQMAQGGGHSFVWFMAFISLNLAIINMFPIPMLDGGHLLFYGIEAIMGRPLGRRIQEYGFRIGLALVLTLMVFVTWNDLVNLRVVDFFRSLGS